MELPVDHIEILVEEQSAQTALEILLPKMTEVDFSIHPHQGKRELIDTLPGRLRGYAKWLPPNYRVIVLVDRDHDNCASLKANLETIASEAQLITRAASGHPEYAVVNRIAVEELEAWFFGDWQAVMAAYPGVSKGVPHRHKYRDPDAIDGGTWEALERLLRQAGYYPAGLPKVEAARAIAQHMDPWANTSKSFQIFRDVVVEMS